MQLQVWIQRVFLTVDGGEIQNISRMIAPRKETMVEIMTLVGIYRAIIRNQAFLGGARMDFIHPQYGGLPLGLYLRPYSLLAARIRQKAPCSLSGLCLGTVQGIRFGTRGNLLGTSRRTLPCGFPPPNQAPSIGPDGNTENKKTVSTQSVFFRFGSRGGIELLIFQ